VTGRYAPLAGFNSTWSPVPYDPDTNPSVLVFSDHILPYFKAYKKQGTPLHEKAFSPTFPNDFMADCKSGKLPKVSWIIPPLGFDEHPSASPERGQWFVGEVLRNIMSNKKVWAKTVVFLMYDENDGWFDHVPPPVAPKGTPGEWLTAKHISTNTNGIRGPLGLGVRVPMVVISPFSRGGHVASEVFDHTSQLQFLAARFGIDVPNVSKWRRKTVGDLTSTLHMHHHNPARPKLPEIALGGDTFVGNCSIQDIEQGGASPMIPTKQTMPTQHGKQIPASHFFAEADTKAERITIRTKRNTATTKSAMNAHAHGKPVPSTARGRNR
jgi:phospholipase C